MTLSRPSRLARWPRSESGGSKDEPNPIPHPMVDISIFPRLVRRLLQPNRSLRRRVGLRSPSRSLKNDRHLRFFSGKHFISNHVTSLPSPPATRHFLCST
jgi:hypothetical protein